VRAMILAAGKGTRLRPLTDSVPKPLVEVAGRPMIGFPLQLVREAGIHDVVINLHHLGHMIRDRLGDGATCGLRIQYSEEDPILDTGGGIAAARRWLNGDTFALLNADTYVDLRLDEVVAVHRRTGALATMVVRPDPEARRRDAAYVDAGGRLWSLLGAHAPQAPAGLAGCERMMYAGVMILEPRIFEYLPAGVYSVTRDVYPRLLAAEEPLYAYVHRGYWRVLDTHEDLAAGRQEIPALLGEATRLC